MIFDIPQRYNCHLSQYLSSILEWKSCDKVFTSDLSAGISFTGGLIKTLHCRDQVVCLIWATYTCVPCGKLFKIPIQLLLPMKKLNRKIKTTSSHLLIWHCKATVGKDHHKKRWHISPSLFHIYPCMTAFMPQSWVAEWEILGHIKRASNHSHLYLKRLSSECFSFQLTRFFYLISINTYFKT